MSMVRADDAISSFHGSTRSVARAARSEAVHRAVRPVAAARFGGHWRKNHSSDRTSVDARPRRRFSPVTGARERGDSRPGAPGRHRV